MTNCQISIEMPTIAQYAAKKTNLLRFTIAIITLQANRPDKNAAKKPATIADIGIPDFSGEKSPSKMSKNVMPKIGINTIKNENRVTSSFLLPNNKPVDIVAPERESPGSTAIA